MKKILILLSLLSFSANAQTYMLLNILEIYDGDTIKTNLLWRLPAPLNKMSIRINGIDTPEMPAKSYAKTGKLGRAKCVKEAELALSAKALVEDIAKNTKLMKISNFRWGKYGGRILADVSINGIDIAEALIDDDLAVEYHGKGAKQNWCQ